MAFTLLPHTSAACIPRGWQDERCGGLALLVAEGRPPGKEAAPNPKSHHALYIYKQLPEMKPLPPPLRQELKKKGNITLVSL